MIGCEIPTGVNCSPEEPCCEDTMAPTLKTVDQLTYRSDEFLDAIKQPDGSNQNVRRRVKASSLLQDSPFRMHPWFAPGHAPVANSCGVLGGWQYENARDYVAGPGNKAYEEYQNKTGLCLNCVLPRANMPIPAGTKGTTVLHSDINKRMQEAQGESYRTNDNPIWEAGTSQNVSWTLSANHGGGYQFRICPLGHLMNNTLDEECFQPLEFIGDTAWFEYSTLEDPEGGTIPFTPIRVTDSNTEGVLPKGSTWTTIGLPACNDCLGGSTFEYFDPTTPFKGHCDPQGAGNCKKPMFENELSDAGYWGYAFGSNGSPAFVDIVENGKWEIVDTIKVPDDIEEGDYVLSWRWDSESTPQVWTSCAVISVEVGISRE